MQLKEIKDTKESMKKEKRRNSYPIYQRTKKKSKSIRE